MAIIDPNVVRRLDEISWNYGDKDPAARAEIQRRIESAGKKYGLITYSSLVEDIGFNLPNLSPKPIYIRTHDWQGLDRKIIGEFLGNINMETYKKHGIFTSALVIGKETSKPSDIFFEWMESLGILPNLHEDTVLKFWAEEVNKVHRFFNGKPI